MRVGDRVRFRDDSRAWRSRGLDPAARGRVMELYRVPPLGEIKADVRFDTMTAPERGLSVEDLEVLKDA
jgi:hypothetical protein